MVKFYISLAVFAVLRKEIFRDHDKQRYVSYAAVDY